MAPPSTPLRTGEREPLLPKTTPTKYAAEQDFKHDAPVADRSKEAWLFLAACWVIEAFVFGFGLSFGVFQDFYHSHGPWAGSDNIAAIGTTTMGFLYMGTPIIIGLCRFFPRSARWFTLFGVILAASSLAISSFCRTIPQLILAQGVLFGIGGCFAFCPCIIYIDQWFIERKSLALGIMFSAGGFGGVVFPPTLEALLNHFGFATAARLWAALFLLISVPMAFFIKPRTSFCYSSHESTNAPTCSFRFLHTAQFNLYQLANVIQASGYFLPGIYIPLYARLVLDANVSQSVLMLMLLNLSTTIGCVAMGALADMYHPTTCALVSSVGATIAVLGVWGFSESLVGLGVFCVLYGLFAGGSPSTWPGIMREVANPSVPSRKRGRVSGLHTFDCEESRRSKPSKTTAAADPMMVYSLLVLGRGIGNAISGPLSDVLVQVHPWKGLIGGGYGSDFGALIVFTGVTSMVAGMGVLWRWAGWL